MRLPGYVQIEPVGQCNLRCRMCPILFRKDGPPYGPPAFMDFDAFTRLVDQFEGLEELHLQGLGEPMMHPRFFDMVRYGAARGVRVTTNTNLTLLNERRARLAVESGLDTMHISIDGATRETYERIRVRAHWEKLLANLEGLLKARAEAVKPKLHLVMVLMKSNLEELRSIVRLAAEWHFEEVFVQHLCHDFSESTLPAEYLPMRQFVDSESVLSEDPNRVESVFAESRAIAAEYSLRLRLPPLNKKEYPPDTPGRQRCDWPWRGAYISYQGYAMPCCMVSTPDRIHFGNMSESGVDRIWNSEAYSEFRSRLDSGPPPEICAACSLYRGTF